VLEIPRTITLFDEEDQFIWQCKSKGVFLLAQLAGLPAHLRG
jgi:hypothetical protein